MKTRADYAQKGEENKYAFEIMKTIFTILSVKEICLWNSCKLPMEPQGFMKESLNTTASVDGCVLMKDVCINWWEIGTELKFAYSVM